MGNVSISDGLAALICCLRQWEVNVDINVHAHKQELTVTTQTCRAVRCPLQRVARGLHPHWARDPPRASGPHARGPHACGPRARGLDCCTLLVLCRTPHSLCRQRPRHPPRRRAPHPPPRRCSPRTRPPRTSSHPGRASCGRCNTSWSCGARGPRCPTRSRPTARAQRGQRQSGGASAALGAKVEVQRGEQRPRPPQLQLASEVDRGTLTFTLSQKSLRSTRASASRREGDGTHDSASSSWARAPCWLPSRRTLLGARGRPRCTAALTAARRCGRPRVRLHAVLGPSLALGGRWFRWRR